MLGRIFVALIERGRVVIRVTRPRVMGCWGDSSPMSTGVTAGMVSANAQT